MRHGSGGGDRGPSPHAARSAACAKTHSRCFANVSIALCERVHDCIAWRSMPVERVRRRIPEATVARLPVYLRILIEQANENLECISSEGLAELAGVNAAKVRKDLSYLG